MLNVTLCKRLNDASAMQRAEPCITDLVVHILAVHILDIFAYQVKRAMLTAASFPVYTARSERRFTLYQYVDY